MRYVTLSLPSFQDHEQKGREELKNLAALLGAKSTTGPRNWVEYAGGTGDLLLLCKINMRLARVVEKRLVKSQKEKKSEKPDLRAPAQSQPEPSL